MELSEWLIVGGIVWVVMAVVVGVAVGLTARERDKQKPPRDTHNKT